MACHFEYTPIPAPFPRVLIATGEFLIRQGRPIPIRPLGILGTAPPTEADESSELVVPTDLLIAAWRGLFPAERMMFLSGRCQYQRIEVSSVRDVTGGARSLVHVTACRDLLREALLDFEAAGTPVAAWLHSHPGHGSVATHPSSIDRRQDTVLRRDFGDRLVGFIATVDGYLRAWGQSIDEQIVRVRLRGRGIEPVIGEPHVYRLVVR